MATRHRLLLDDRAERKLLKLEKLRAKSNKHLPYSNKFSQKQIISNKITNEKKIIQDKVREEATRHILKTETKENIIYDETKHDEKNKHLTINDNIHKYSYNGLSQERKERNDLLYASIRSIFKTNKISKELKMGNHIQDKLNKQNELKHKQYHHMINMKDEVYENDIHKKTTMKRPHTTPIQLPSQHLKQIDSDSFYTYSNFKTIISKREKHFWKNFYIQESRDFKRDSFKKTFYTFKVRKKLLKKLELKKKRDLEKKKNAKVSLNSLHPPKPSIVYDEKWGRMLTCDECNEVCIHSYICCLYCNITKHVQCLSNEERKALNESDVFICKYCKDGIETDLKTYEANKKRLWQKRLDYYGTTLVGRVLRRKIRHYRDKKLKKKVILVQSVIRKFVAKCLLVKKRRRKLRPMLITFADIFDFANKKLKHVSDLMLIVVAYTNDNVRLFRGDIHVGESLLLPGLNAFSYLQFTLIDTSRNSHKLRSHLIGQCKIELGGDETYHLGGTFMKNLMTYNLIIPNELENKLYIGNKYSNNHQNHQIKIRLYTPKYFHGYVGEIIGPSVETLKKDKHSQGFKIKSKDDMLNFRYKFVRTYDTSTMTSKMKEIRDSRRWWGCILYGILFLYRSYGQIKPKVVLDLSVHPIKSSYKIEVQNINDNQFPNNGSIFNSSLLSQDSSFLFDTNSSYQPFLSISSLQSLTRSLITNKTSKANKKILMTVIRNNDDLLPWIFNASEKNFDKWSSCIQYWTSQVLPPLNLNKKNNLRHEDGLVSPYYYKFPKRLKRKKKKSFNY